MVKAFAVALGLCVLFGCMARAADTSGRVITNECPFGLSVCYSDGSPIGPILQSVLNPDPLFTYSGTSHAITVPKGSDWTCEQSDGSPCPQPPVAKDEELNAARKICHQHTVNNPFVSCFAGVRSPITGNNFTQFPPPYPFWDTNQCAPVWDEKWKACNEVEMKWTDSETARRQKEYYEQIERDLQFIRRIAGEKK